MSQVTRQQFLESLHNGVDLGSESLQQALDGTGAMAQLKKVDQNGDGKLTGQELEKAFVVVEQFDPHHGQESFEDSGLSGRAWHALLEAPSGGWRAQGAAPGDRNTIACDKAGGIQILLNGTGEVAQWALAGECVRKHEESHKRDALEASPDVCRGQPEGTWVRPGNKEVQAKTEIKAANSEIECLREKLSFPDDRIRSIIRTRIHEEERYRDSFQKK